MAWLVGDKEISREFLLLLCQMGIARFQVE